ncbi:MAG TPA: hypothetical protein VGI40_04105, partial [Pirellulaceae bacterium]
ALAKGALRRRVMSWYSRFNDERWSDCYALIDPSLASSGKVNAEAYTHSLRNFRSRYGTIRPWHVRISLHLTGSRPTSDSRPFAYVYTVWQDDRHEFHMFRERWVQEGKNWYTRVAGLVLNEATFNQAG